MGFTAANGFFLLVEPLAGLPLTEVPPLSFFWAMCSLQSIKRNEGEILYRMEERPALVHVAEEEKVCMKERARIWIEERVFSKWLNQ